MSIKKSHVIEILENNAGSRARTVSVVIDGTGVGGLMAPYFDEENVIGIEDCHKAYDEEGCFIGSDAHYREVRSVLRIVAMYLEKRGEQ